MKTMGTLIQRVIYLDSLKDFDSQNIGNHWTKNLKYSHHGGGQHGITKIEGKIKVLIVTKIDSVLINDSKTKESNEEYPSECEVVLECNQDIAFQMYVSMYSTQNECWYPINRESNHIIHNGNTGTRIDDWAK